MIFGQYFDIWKNKQVSCMNNKMSYFGPLPKSLSKREGLGLVLLSKFYYIISFSLFTCMNKINLFILLFVSCLGVSAQETNYNPIVPDNLADPTIVEQLFDIRQLMEEKR